jgi:branched-chain amino acid transport system permease protein
LFIELVPNLASDISDAAPWALYGLAMLLFMFAMPRGVVGSLRPWFAWATRRLGSSRVVGAR